MFSLIYAWTNSYVNNEDAGGLRRHRAYYYNDLVGNVAALAPITRTLFTIPSIEIRKIIWWLDTRIFHPVPILAYIAIT